MSDNSIKNTTSFDNEKFTFVQFYDELKMLNL